MRKNKKTPTFTGRGSAFVILTILFTNNLFLNGITAILAEEPYSTVPTLMLPLVL